MKGMTDADPTRSRAMSRRLYWIAAGVFAVLVATLLWGLFGPEPPIRVARETTYLTAPLAADGLPDYEAAWLATLGPAPPPEENAAVLLLQTCWPLLENGATDLPAVCKALGIPNVPPAESLVLYPPRDPASGVTDAMLETAEQWPWTTEELPAVAAWLAKNERLIDRLVEAADRPHYWLPSPSFLDGTPDPLWNITLPDIQAHRGVARVLGYRVRWHLGENRPAAAWRDVRAIHRLSRLLAPPGRGPQCVVTQLVAIAVEANANEATRLVLATPGLPADLLATIRRDLESLGPTVAVSDGMASERLLGVDMVVGVARRTAGGRTGRAERFADLTGVRITSTSGISRIGGGEPVLLTSLDWNLVLERFNLFHDDAEAACRLPTHQDRKAAADKVTADLRSRTAARSGWTWAAIGDGFLSVCSRGHRSARLADRILDQLAAGCGWMDASTRSAAQFALTKTAAALAAWHADRGPDSPPYPERLDDLVPRYLAAVPVDPFTDKPFIYERRGDGYLVASVGMNGVYDGGDDYSGWIVRGEWQERKQDVDHRSADVVVRMPIPPRKPADR
jgi:hypothetical protein